MGEFNDTANGENEIIKDFLNELCILGKDKRVRGVDLHNKYIEYSREKNKKALELIPFYKELDKICGKQIVKSRWYEGQKRIRGFDGIDIR